MLTNTKLFTETRDYFLKHGVYTKALKGTYQYRDFWKNELDKCINGITIGNLYIPGEYYFYLNFTRMRVFNPKTNRKHESFPSFTDVDLEYFLIVKEARKQKKGVILLKPRRTGFSYKNAGLVVYEYIFFRDSVSVIGSYENKWSKPCIDAITSTLNFLDIHTIWYRPRNPDQLNKDYCKAQHKVKDPETGAETWRGYMSEIHRVTFKDNAGASAGKSTSLFLFEEAGYFVNIKESYALAEPTWMDGNEMVGTPIIYGTGGDMGPGAIAFSEMFYSPEQYNLLAFDNIWEPSQEHTKCGWFLPANRQRFGILKDEHKNPIFDEKGRVIKLVDDNGNSNIEASTQDVLNERKRKKFSRISITEYPLTPSEGFLISVGNMFPTLELKDLLAELKSNPGKYQDMNWVGDLFINEEGKVEQKIDLSKKPIRAYPTPKEIDLESTVEIFEQPDYLSDGTITPRRYIVGSDPYDDDQVKSIDSLGSIFVFDRLTRKIVAEYTGRVRASEFYEIFRMLIIYYNGIGFPEINKIGVVNYFINKKCTYLLAETPNFQRDNNWLPNLNTSFGYKRNKQTIAWGNELTRDWLISKSNSNDEKRNLHYIRSIGLVEELIKYNPSPDYNFDRLSALHCCLILDAVMTEQVTKETVARVKSFIDDEFFKNMESGYTDAVSYFNNEFNKN